MNRFHKLQATALGVLLSAATVQVVAEGSDIAGYGFKTGWEDPVVQEFNKLDTTGNGLLKPNEASRGNAFNKKTFAKADQDHDGYIDQNEYVYFKTGTWPQTNQPQGNVPASVPMSPTVEPGNIPTEMPPEVVPPNDNMSLLELNDNSYDLNDESMSAELQSLIEAHEQELAQAKEKANGIANQDNVINAKAITTILATDDLEGMQISVDTNEGEVFLNGYVRSQKDKMKAEYVVSRIDGVKAVKNDLIVRI